MCAGQLPPIIVHRQTMRVVDGWHRLQAAGIRGDATIPVRFFDGNEQDAFVLAVRLNAKHGLPLSAADRRAAAERIVASHPSWSNRAIAAVVGIADKTVASIRRQRNEGVASEVSRVGLDGRTRPVSSADGRRRAGEFIARHPDASLREIARSVGISPGTARDVRTRLERGEDPVATKQRDTDARQDTAPVRQVTRPPRDDLAARRTSVEQPTPVLDLRRDPRLRFTDAGRLLLRFLEFRALDELQRRRLLEAVPTYQSGAVARIARECARSWQMFADQLERRERYSA
ncbi:ParB/RepB/Spo0J family partition protein [Micromonospora antibiotica]|uniref:ParB N-terminal domain-containing protein n=1 Tax=Micromonospora antibiotica TaxID=2807623 RepID=A0ABS3V2C5_9ACTN|nr:ParB N-terminal domain-containing protein [Micromonospora antibiotica]MBO4159722.1 ParB N-terminal domain-containing protein [Micromonospora antibiotica]